MRKIQPISLTADGADCYRLRSKTNKEAEKILAIFEKYPDQHRIRSQADKDKNEIEHLFHSYYDEGKDFKVRRTDEEENLDFFRITDDDPARLVIMSCVIEFDDARVKGVEISGSALIRPISITVAGQDSSGASQYKVVFETGSGQVEYLFTATDGDDLTVIVKWDYGCQKLRWDIMHGAIENKDVAPIIHAVGWFHAAVHYEHYLAKYLPQYLPKEQKITAQNNQLHA